MTHVSGRTPTVHPPPARSGEVRVAAEPQPVGWAFIALYEAAYVGTCLVLIAPLLVTLALRSTRSWAAIRHRTAWPGHRGRRPGGDARQTVLPVADVLPAGDNAKDLGVLDIAGALPCAVAPALAPVILAVGAGATACCTRSRDRVPSSARSPSCPCDGRAEVRNVYRSLPADIRSSSSPRRTAERRLLTPSFA